MQRRIVRNRFNIERCAVWGGGGREAKRCLFGLSIHFGQGEGGETLEAEWGGEMYLITRFFDRKDRNDGGEEIIRVELFLACHGLPLLFPWIFALLLYMCRCLQKVASDYHITFFATLWSSSSFALTKDPCTQNFSGGNKSVGITAAPCQKSPPRFLSLRLREIDCCMCAYYKFGRVAMCLSSSAAAAAVFFFKVSGRGQRPPHCLGCVCNAESTDTAPTAISHFLVSMLKYEAQRTYQC